MPLLTSQIAAPLSAALLGVYIVLIVSSMLKTGRGHDPQRGQAVGCLLIVVFCLLLLEGLFALGWFLHIPRLVQGATITALFPLVLLLLNGVEAGVRALRRR